MNYYEQPSPRPVVVASFSGNENYIEWVQIDEDAEKFAVLVAKVDEFGIEQVKVSRLSDDYQKAQADFIGLLKTEFGVQFHPSMFSQKTA